MLMSRITNDTSAMQAALSQVSSDAFKQPVSIVLVVSVLLYMLPQSEPRIPSSTVKSCR